MNVVGPETFIPKEEFTRLPFDPNVRQRFDDMDNTLIWRSMVGLEPDYEPQSNYVAIKHNGKTWHLFNAARFPLGRMAEMISIYIRGKHKPVYDAKYSGEHGDFCVVVNASKQYVTGNKKNWKMYRNYTGYVGNMKETVMRLQLERRPEEVLFHAVKGMLPKNKLKDKIIQQRLFIYPGPYHDLLPDKLPQFTTSDPININEVFEFGEEFRKRQHEYKIVHASDMNDLPEEFKDLEVDYNEELGIPLALTKKTSSNPRANTHLQAQMNKNNRVALRKYKRYKKKQ